MPKLSLIIILLYTAIMVSSCFKDDEAVVPHKAGEYVTDTVSLTDNYKNQVFYSLFDSSAVITNHKDSWDLGFESSPLGWRVVLNSACFMKAAFLEGQDFGFPVDTSGIEWKFNPSDGSADSLAIGQWFSLSGNDTLGTNRLILLDRGIDVNGNPRGYNQLVIDSLVGGIYYFKLAGMTGTNITSFSVAKKAGVRNLLFSISNPASTIEEPSATEWDIVFTQYTTLLFTDIGEPYPYLVTGVLINNKYAEIAVDSITAFADIDFSKAQSMAFSRQANRIGYDWKIYNFDDGTYEVNSDKVFIIRDTKGFLYKLRFIGFYKFVNNDLKKGYPSFEYQKL